MTISRSEIKCPFCPVCGTPPMQMWLEIMPWFCPNDDCQVFTWWPLNSALKNLQESEEMELMENVPPDASSD